MLSPTFSSSLAIVVALASAFLFLIGVLAPRLYRPQDFFWSGVGLFYAVVLWFCSAQIRGAVLLGTIASVSLLGWLGTQTYLARWATLTEAEKAAGTLKRLRGLGQGLQKVWERSNAVPVAPQPVDKASDPLEETLPEDATIAQTMQDSGSSPVSSQSSEKPEFMDLDPLAWAAMKAEAEAPSEETHGEAADPELVDPETVDPDATHPELADPDAADPTIVNVTPEAEPLEEWDDLADEAIEEDEEDLAAETSASPAPLATPSPQPKVGLFQRAQNFFQGRKSHGKRFVRPEEATSSPTGKSSSTKPAKSPTSKPSGATPPAAKSASASPPKDAAKAAAPDRPVVTTDPPQTSENSESIAPAATDPFTALVAETSIVAPSTPEPSPEAAPIKSETKSETLESTTVDPEPMADSHPEVEATVTATEPIAESVTTEPATETEDQSPTTESTPIAPAEGLTEASAQSDRDSAP